MCVCLCVSVCVCMCVCVCACMCMCVCIHMCIYIYTYESLSTSKYVRGTISSSFLIFPLSHSSLVQVSNLLNFSKNSLLSISEISLSKLNINTALAPVSPAGTYTCIECTYIHYSLLWNRIYIDWWLNLLTFIWNLTKVIRRSSISSFTITFNTFLSLTLLNGTIYEIDR